MDVMDEQKRRALYAALAALINLTVLPVLAFIALLYIYRTTTPNTFDHYHVVVAIKTSLWAAFSLIVVTTVMILLGGFYSPWTWVYVISYFVLIHALFILFATWTLTCAWSGEKLKKSFLSK